MVFFGKEGKNASHDFFPCTQFGCIEVADDQQRKTDYMEITIDLSTCRNFQDNDKVLGGSCSFFSNVFVSSAGINAVKVKVIS